MFGMGLGMDMGMGMGMDMGMMMGMEMGMGMGGMGMGMGMGGMGYGRQQIIVNNGYGGGTTIIENGGGFFGPRQQIIINNGYGGMRNNNNVVIIQERGGMFGPREEIIITNGGYGGNGVVVCQPGCRKACCYRACPANCQNSCCNNVVYGTTQNYGTNQQYTQNYAQKPQYVQQNTQNQQYVKQNVQSNPTQPVSNQVASNQPNQNLAYTNTNKAQYNPYGNYNNNYNDVPEKSQVPQVMVRHEMYELQYATWNGPKPFMLSIGGFDKFNMSLIKKVKCRTNYEPFSNSLNHGQIVMKIVAGTQDLYYAAHPDIVGDYFNKLILLKFKFTNFPQNIVFSGEISGSIYKKSDVLGNWEIRHVKITKQDGLKSYKNPSHHHTVHIKSIKQIWTWFQIFQGKFLVIKIKHHTKVQFAIPLANCQAWLAAFYSLLQHYS